MLSKLRASMHESINSELFMVLKLEILLLVLLLYNNVITRY